MKVYLTKKEYDFIAFILDFPIGMLYDKRNVNYFYEKFGVHESELEVMVNKMDKFKSNSIDEKICLDFSEDDYKEFIKYFKAAKTYADPVELPILTSWTWDEAEKLEKKLEGFLE